MLDVAGRWHGTLRTGDVTYTGFQETDRDVGIKTDWLRAQDLYVIADFRRGRTRSFFKVLVKPLVNLIWVAGIVFVLGSLVALWPDAREQRRSGDAPRARARVTTLGIVLGALRRGDRDRARRAAVPARARDGRRHAATRRTRSACALVEDRDRALAALKELEFDHRTGKIGDDDYRELVAPLRQAAAAALQAIDRYGPAMETPTPSRADAAARRGHAADSRARSGAVPASGRGGHPASLNRGVTAPHGETSSHAAARARLPRRARPGGAGTR